VGGGQRQPPVEKTLEQLAEERYDTLEGAMEQVQVGTHPYTQPDGKVIQLQNGVPVGRNVSQGIVYESNQPQHQQPRHQTHYHAQTQAQAPLQAAQHRPLLKPGYTAVIPAQMRPNAPHVMDGGAPLHPPEHQHTHPQPSAPPLPHRIDHPYRSNDGAVRVFDRNLRSRMPLVPTPARFKSSEQACDQWHSSRMSTFLTGSHCELRPNNEGAVIRQVTVQCPLWAG
jgi:hypothetical protein